MEDYIMSREHPRWREFIQLLKGKDGCNIRKNKDGRVISDCSGDTNKSNAVRIIRSIDENIDIEKSIAYFEANGGFCDCEIVFNVPLRMKNEQRKEQRKDAREYIKQKQIRKQGKNEST